MTKPGRKSPSKSQNGSLQNTSSKASKKEKEITPEEIAKLVPAMPNFPDLPKVLAKQLHGIPQEQLNAVGKKVSLQFMSQVYTSPYPQPEVLAGLEDVCPGSANRIIDIVEQSQAKKLEIADANIRKSDNEGSILKAESETGNTIALAQVSQSKSGMIIAAILIFFFLIVSAFFAYIKNNGAAWAFGTGGIVSIIIAFHRFIKIPIKWATKK